jgi:hypothetical protein
MPESSLCELHAGNAADPTRCVKWPVTYTCHRRRVCMLFWCFRYFRYLRYKRWFQGLLTKRAHCWQLLRYVGLLSRKQVSFGGVPTRTERVELVGVAYPWASARPSQSIGSESFLAVAATLSAPYQPAIAAKIMARSELERGTWCWAHRLRSRQWRRRIPLLDNRGCGTAGSRTLGKLRYSHFFGGWLSKWWPLALVGPG